MPLGAPERDCPFELVMGTDMKKKALLATALAMMTGSAFAADMPVKAVQGAAAAGR